MWDGCQSSVTRGPELLLRSGMRAGLQRHRVLDAALPSDVGGGSWQGKRPGSGSSRTLVAAQELSGNSNLVGLDVNSLASVQDGFSSCREQQLVGAQEPKPVGSPSIALVASHAACTALVTLLTSGIFRSRACH